jgi:3'-5' exoribonuclease
VTPGPIAAEPVDALAFCGRVPWPLISELSDGEDVAACYVVRDSRKLQTKSNQDYLRLTLGDRTGTIDGVVWDQIEVWEPVCTAKAVVGIRGKVSFYQGRPQLRVVSAAPVRTTAAELAYLLPTSPRDQARMERELEAIVASVRDRHLRSLLMRCLGPETELGAAYRQHPAATRNHHAYVSGLLEHSVSVASACDRLAEHYATQGVHLDRDLLVTGALLHDIGKIRELDPPPATAYTTAGRLLGHIVLGMQMVQREAAKIPGFPEDRLLHLQHLIASHQGKPEWDSPRVPQVLEAMVLHYADDLDAKVNQARTLLSSVAPGEWSDYDRSLGRSFLRLPGEPPAPPPTAADDADDPGGVIDLFRD